MKGITLKSETAKAQKIIEHFNMQPLPDEGGYFTETYRANEIIPAGALPERYGSQRNHSTSILYLITDRCCSKLHKVASDEIFHFHLGSAVNMLWLMPDGSSKTIQIGNNIFADEKPQVVVPRGIWQGSYIDEPDGFALLSCAVSPGFEFEDYENGQREELISGYPERKYLIEKLT